MEFRVGSAFLVFSGSYLPLSIILLIKDYKVSAINDRICWGFVFDSSSCYIPFLFPWLSLTVVVFCSLCLALSIYLLSKVRCKREVMLISVKHMPIDLMNYVLPYIVAFMTLDYGDKKELLGFGVFLLWLFWITYKSGRSVLNPVLVVFGWRLYEVVYTEGKGAVNKSGVMLANTEPFPTTYVNHNKFQDVMIVRREQ